MPGNKRGYTSFTNESLRNGSLPDYLFRFMVVMESHLGSSGRAKVKLGTIAKEMGKNRKSAERAKKWFLTNSNLREAKHGYLYEFYTAPDMSVLYGKTHVSHIMVHPCTTTKRILEKDLFKNPKEVFSNKGEEEGVTPMFSGEEMALVDEILEWVTRPVFKTILPEKTEKFRIMGMIRKYGFEQVKKTYNDTAKCSASPHPKLFWDALKGLNDVVKKP